jgi:predicted ATP-grasp superfamily ATP-dependent carboligase
MPVLVLDGHSRAAVETVQSLGRAGLEVDVASEFLPCAAMHSRHAARKLQQPPPLVPNDFHRWLHGQDRRRNYELIVPTTETSLMSLRLLSESDALRRRAVLPSDHAIDVALDKFKTWQLGRDLGVPTPETALVSREQNLGVPANYPVVVKSLHSKTIVDGVLRTVAAEIIRDEDAYRRQVEQWLPFTAIVRQEYVTGRGVGAEFLFDRGKKVWHFVHERVHEVPLSGGASSYRRSIPPMPALLTDAERILTSLEWHGVAMVEFRVDLQGQHRLIEINPRLWGSLALAIDAGVDFPLGLWLLAQGSKMPPQPPYRTYYYTRDLANDVEWFKARIRANPNDSPLLTKSTLASLAEILRPLAGRESWDHFDVCDLAPTRVVLTDLVVRQLRLLFRKAFAGMKRPFLKRRHVANGN